MHMMAIARIAWKPPDEIVGCTNLIQCKRRKRPAYSMAADAIAALKNNAGSHHPCIAKNPDNDPANHRSGFGADLIKLQ